MADPNYRQGANAVIINPLGQILLVQKVKYKENEWEFPGGGLDEGEDIKEGIIRELHEELGNNTYEVIAESSIKYTFDWPDSSIESAYQKYGIRWKGQQKTIFFIFINEIDPRFELQEEEIRTYKWVPYNVLEKHFVFEEQYETSAKIIVNEVKNIMNLGWQAREALHFPKAYGLLNFSKTVFESINDWYNVTECLNHLAYTHKLEGVHHSVEGLKEAELSEQVALTNNTKKGSVYRALMSLASSAGNFELALKYSLQCLNETSKPLPQADVLSHIATFYMRTGNLTEAENTIIKAETLYKDNYSKEEEPHRSIWHTRILFTKAIILFNKGNKEESKKILLEALEIANKQSLATRQVEINNLLKLF